jgi:DNA-binding transcriptional LysR family regulator
VQDQTLVVRKLGDFSLGLFASPAYLKEHKAPTTIEQLSQHRCIVFLQPSTHRPLPWEFTTNPRQYTPPVLYEISGDPLGQITLACAGVGVIQMYHFLVEREVATKKLIELAPTLGGATRRFSLLYPKNLVQSRAVKAFVQFVLE